MLTGHDARGGYLLWWDDSALGHEVLLQHTLKKRVVNGCDMRSIKAQKLIPSSDVRDPHRIFRLKFANYLETNVSQLVLGEMHIFPENVLKSC